MIELIWYNPAIDELFTTIAYPWEYDHYNYMGDKYYDIYGTYPVLLGEL